MNFDLDTLAPFLERVAGLVDSGVEEQEIAALVTEVSALEVDAEKHRRYSVVVGLAEELGM